MSMELQETLDFLNSIEGSGYGGMASFEIARSHVRDAITAQPQRPAEALRLLADLFSESVHQTWTRGEIVNVIEDAIRLGSSRPETYCTVDGRQWCESVSDSGRCGFCPVTRPERCTPHE